MLRSGDVCQQISDDGSPEVHLPVFGPADSRRRVSTTTHGEGATRGFEARSRQTRISPLSATPAARLLITSPSRASTEPLGRANSARPFRRRAENPFGHTTDSRVPWAASANTIVPPSRPTRMGVTPAIGQLKPLTGHSLQGCAGRASDAAPGGNGAAWEGPSSRMVAPPRAARTKRRSKTDRPRLTGTTPGSPLHLRSSRPNGVITRPAACTTVLLPMATRWWPVGPVSWRHGGPAATGQRRSLVGGARAAESRSTRAHDRGPGRLDPLDGRPRLGVGSRHPPGPTRHATRGVATSGHDDRAISPPRKAIAEIFCKVLVQIFCAC